MTYSIDAYKCSRCQEVVFHTIVTSLYHGGRSVRIYSDGYSQSMGSRRFVQCPLCAHYQRSQDLIPLNKSIRDYVSDYPDFLEEDELGRRNPRQVVGLGLAEYCQLIHNLPFPLTKDEELYIRNRIRWGFNSFFREYSENVGITYSLSTGEYVRRRIRLPKRCEIGNAFWQENLKRIVDLNSGITVNECLSKADALRCLGDFQRALSILQSIEQLADLAEETGLTEMQRIAYEELSHACRRKNRRPFVVRDPHAVTLWW
ncbi:hypothetical protein GCM10028805_10760 [Spirosoma harenae]